MSKININLKLFNKTTNNLYTINTKCIKSDNEIKFYDNYTLNIYNINNSYLIRKNKEYNIELDFKNNKGYINTNNLKLDFKIKTNFIKKNDNYIEIDYIIYMDGEEKYNYRIEW